MQTGQHLLHRCHISVAHAAQSLLAKAFNELTPIGGRQARRVQRLWECRRSSQDRALLRDILSLTGLCSVIHVRTQPGVLRYARFVDVGGGRGGAYAGRNWQRSVIGRHGCSCTSYNHITTRVAEQFVYMLIRCSFCLSFCFCTCCKIYIVIIFNTHGQHAKSMY